MPSIAKTVTAVVLASLFVGGCSVSDGSKRQADGDKSYLKTAELKPLTAPEGVSLPLRYADYAIPQVEARGELGDKIDIRPPVQPIAIFTGSRVQAAQNYAEIRFEAVDANLLSQLQHVFSSKQYPVKSQGASELGSVWISDWISWPRLDEPTPYQAKYEITAFGEGYSNMIAVKLLELRNDNKPVSDADEISRYTALMLNSLSEGVYQEQSRQVARDAMRDMGQFVVQNSVDETGLPLLVVRSTYDMIWQALPAAFDKISMTASESNHSQGVIVLKYKPLSEKVLNAQGVDASALKSGDYNLQVGDLDNRTSLQLRDSKGKPVSQAENDAFLALMKYAFS